MNKYAHVWLYKILLEKMMKNDISKGSFLTCSFFANIKLFDFCRWYFPRRWQKIINILVECNPNNRIENGIDNVSVLSSGLKVIYIYIIESWMIKMYKIPDLSRVGRNKRV